MQQPFYDRRPEQKVSLNFNKTSEKLFAKIENDW